MSVISVTMFRFKQIVVARLIGVALLFAFHGSEVCVRLGIGQGKIRGAVYRRVGLTSVGGVCLQYTCLLEAIGGVAVVRCLRAVPYRRDL